MMSSPQPAKLIDSIMIKKILLWIVLLLIVYLSILFWNTQVESAQQQVDFSQTEYVGSETCKDCHKDRHKSWSKTYHKTMTQEANEASVLGEFNGQAQTYWGYTIRPIKKGGKFFFAYYDSNNEQLLNEIEIVRTVGSRRYQQYMAQTDNTEGNYYRLELLWHIEDQRWIHLNGAFLDSDNQSFSEHTGIWNQNCIFCHNTGINPGMTNYNQLVERSKAGEPVNMFTDARFESEVEELGISCESCHSPAKTHSKLSQNPFRKYYFHFTEQQDPSIVHPKQLDQQAALGVCGQCHGQRIPENLSLARTWREEGPTFRPGQKLEAHVSPIWQDTQGGDTRGSAVVSGKCNLIDNSNDWPVGSFTIGTAEFINPAGGDSRQLSSSAGVDMCQQDTFAWSIDRDIEYQVSPVNENTNPQGMPGEAGGLYDAGFDEVYDNIGEDEFLLTVQREGSGDGFVISDPLGISCGTDCTEVVFNGTLVTLTATAFSGSEFIGWGSCPLVNGSNQCLTSVTQSQTVFAEFQPDDLIFSNGFE